MPDQPSAQADNNSIAVGSIVIGGDVSGNIHVGNVGYTAEEVSALLTEITSTFQAKPFDGRCPYKGLDVFEEEDSELFFGREKLVDDLVNRVKESRTVFITGPSGSGKSSLVRAGLIHALKQGAIKSSERWLYATMKPGRDPIGELGRVVSNLAGTTNAEDEIRGKALADATIFARWCEIALKEGRDKRVVLFIDQFEEVFTQIGKEAERVAFLNLLTYAATIDNGRVIILFSMRSDFVSNCATYPQINALLNQQFVQIGAMQPEELVSAIAQPALRVGLRIDPDLIAQIINEMKGEPGALPLMQFALKDLFDSQGEKSGVIALTLNDYLQRGGIHKALERHADDAFSKLSKSEQELARSIFSGLIEIGRGTQDTRRTALFDELIPANTKSGDIEAIVQKLADARLITTDEAAGKDTVTISHEKLIDAWPWLKKLVNENRDVIALQNEISADAKEWEEHKRDASYLYSGGRLATAQEKIKDLTLSEMAQRFLKTALQVEKDAYLQRERRLRLTVIASIAAAIIFLVLGSFGWVKSNEATNQAATAQSASTLAFDNAATAQANANIAATEKVHAEVQANIALARQLVSQAQFINAQSSKNQMISALLDIQSMKLFVNGDAANFLINTNHAGLPIARMTHDNGVNSVAFSPDGKYVVSGSADNTVRVWEASTGKEAARMTHDYYEVTSVAFSPDGKYVVSGGDFTARVWETETGKEVARITHDGGVISVAFSPNGKYVVSGSEDGTARVWEAETGKEVARMTHDDGVTSVTFSPGGKYVVSGSRDGTARVWEAETGKEVARMTHDGVVIFVVFSPNGKYVASVSDMTTSVWKAETGEEVAHVIHDGWVHSVAFSSDGKYMVSGSAETTYVWETETGDEIAHMTQDGLVNSVAFSPDRMYMVSGSDDGTARVWEWSGKEVARMTHDGPVTSVAFSADGKYVVSGSDDGTVRVWKAEKEKEDTHIIHDWDASSVAFSPDGKYIVSEDGYHTVSVWEAATGKEVSHMAYDDWVYSVAFSADGKYVVLGIGDTVRVLDVSMVLNASAETGKEVVLMSHDGEALSVAFSPDGKYVVSGSRDNTARVWEVKTGKEVARMTHDDTVTSVAFSPDGKYVVSGSSDNTVRVWEAETGREVVRMIHGGEVLSVAFSPDGKYVASGSRDNTARVWEVKTGKEVARMNYDGAVASVAFSPDTFASTDEKYVVSGGCDKPKDINCIQGSARVWEAKTGKEVARMTYDGEVIFVTFSPGGKYVVSIYGSIGRVWTWQAEDLITNACRVMPRNLTQAEWNQYIGDALPYQAVCPNLPIEAEVTPTPNPTSTP